MTANTAKNIDTMSFEEALVELEAIVGQLESGQAPLEQSIGSYERGVALRKHCEQKLSDAQEKIEKITIGADGKPQTEPFGTSE